MSGKRINGEHSVYKYGGRWHVSGWLGPKRTRVSGKTQSDALARWEKRVSAATATVTPPEAVMEERSLSQATVAEALDQWFELNSHRWKYSTQRGYRHDIDTKINPHLGQLPATELNVPRVEKWLNVLQAAGCASSSTVRSARRSCHHRRCARCGTCRVTGSS